MVLQASGLISLSNIKSEFNGIDPVELSDYYRGGVYVPDLPLNANVPTSGTINVRNFYGSTLSTFNISPNVSTVNEGETVRFNVTSTNFSGTLYWSILGGVTNSDFSSPASAVTSGGTLTISENSGLLDLTTSSDRTTEGSESFSVRLKALSSSGPIVTQSSNVFINNTSLNPFYVTLATSQSPIIGPNSVNFTLIGNSIPNGRTVGYTITGIRIPNDTNAASLSGTFTMSSNTATVSLPLNSIMGELFVVDINPLADVQSYDANISLQTTRIPRRQQFQNISNSQFVYMFWKPDGTSLFLANTLKDSVDQYNLSRPFDTTSATITTANAKALPSAITAPLGMYISSGGTNLLIMDSVDKRIYRMSIGTAWNISTLSATTFASPVLPLVTYRGLELSANGILYFVCAVSTGSVNVFKGTTAFRPDTMSTTLIEDFNPPEPSTPTSIRFNSTGTAMYLADQSPNVSFYTLSTPYTLSTATLVHTQSFSAFAGGLQISDVYWNNVISRTATITTALSDSGGTSTGPKSNSVVITI